MIKATTNSTEYSVDDCSDKLINMFGEPFVRKNKEVIYLMIFGTEFQEWEPVMAKFIFDHTIFFFDIIIDFNFNGASLHWFFYDVTGFKKYITMYPEKKILEILRIMTARYVGSMRDYVSNICARIFDIIISIRGKELVLNILAQIILLDNEKLADFLKVTIKDNSDLKILEKCTKKYGEKILTHIFISLCSPCDELVEYIISNNIDSNIVTIENMSLIKNKKDLLALHNYFQYAYGNVDYIENFMKMNNLLGAYNHFLAGNCDHLKLLKCIIEIIKPDDSLVSKIIMKLLKLQIFNLDSLSPLINFEYMLSVLKIFEEIGTNIVEIVEFHINIDNKWDPVIGIFSFFIESGVDVYDLTKITEMQIPKNIKGKVGEFFIIDFDRDHNVSNIPMIINDYREKYYSGEKNKDYRDCFLAKSDNPRNGYSNETVLSIVNDFFVSINANNEIINDCGPFFHYLLYFNNEMSEEDEKFLSKILAKIYCMHNKIFIKFINKIDIDTTFTITNSSKAFKKYILPCNVEEIFKKWNGKINHKLVNFIVSVTILSIRKIYPGKIDDRIIYLLNKKPIFDIESYHVTIRSDENIELLKKIGEIFGIDGLSNLEYNISTPCLEIIDYLETNEVDFDNKYDIHHITSEELEIIYKKSSVQSIVDNIKYVSSINNIKKILDALFFDQNKFDSASYKIFTIIAKQITPMIIAFKNYCNQGTALLNALKILDNYGVDFRNMMKKYVTCEKLEPSLFFTYFLDKHISLECALKFFFYVTDQ